MHAPTEPAIDTSPSPGDEVKTTTCYMCACRCGIKVWLRDGRVRYIQGNPEHPVNQGVLCAKGSAGIMQHYSPARLDKPLLRVGERGSGEFREIEWDEALQIATDWLAPIRERNPDELAFFTGRDQSQALTGWWAQQFGTVNYAAHGGFCSVNMAAGGLYTLGGSFWEFGEPDWEHTQYLMLWGVAEDHDSNPIKLGLGKLKGRGAKIVAVNPVRSGYGAIADEWIGIRPGTDGLFAFALIHELLKADRIDLDYLVRYTNAHWLVVRNPGGADDGLFARDAEGRPLCWQHVAEAAAMHADTTAGTSDSRTRTGRAVAADAVGIRPAVVGEVSLPDGRRAVPAFHLLAERYLDPRYAPDAVSERCGIPADTIRRIARELAEAAFEREVRLPIAWTDAWGRTHAEMVGRPVALHAMRGISAHSNGFHTCRALHLLQLLLGAVDTPGSFRYQPPYPKPVPPPNRPGKARQANGALDAAPLGFVHGPEDLLVDADGAPRRIDHAFSWAYPLSSHGMMHTVIRNAWAGDPYRIDTLLMFMANMGWNSAMNTAQTIGWLTDKDDDGEYRIPHIIYADAYASETVAYADLVLPDTTYLERFDAISLLDRPISDADGAADAIRHPVLDPALGGSAHADDGNAVPPRPRDVRGFQSVLLDLGARLGLPGMVDEDGSPKYRDYADYIVRHERAPGVGLLAGWRGEDGTREAKGAPNPDQLQRYIEHGGFWRSEAPEHARYFKMANRGYLDWAQRMGFLGHADPIPLQLYSETLQKFRLAAQGHGTHQPPVAHRERVATYFDPLPIWYEPFEGAQADDLGERSGDSAFPAASSAAAATPVGHVDATARGSKPHPYPLSAVTQRPMFMYHAWGSQNAWLRQIASRNVLYLHPDTGIRHGIGDEDWINVTSHHGTITVQARFAANVQPDTVWTWNAIGKRKGAWRLGADAPEASHGFLLNHLISDITPRGDYANADPVTGQAAWFDLRVRIAKVDPRGETAPQFAPLPYGTADNAPLRYGAAFRKGRKPGDTP
ncbi:molybdopterin oxidoreductase family protein [Aerolutibacter daejeonensis]|nr:molybdopterin oxidoreductase family protein [Lysobacter daejeonensis]